MNQPVERPAASSGAVIGVDTGGTFTDASLFDPRSGNTWTYKTPSTPEDPSLGFMEGLRGVLAAAGLDGGAVSRVLHGTTVATNLILERKGPPAALLVTRGFRYVLEIGRHDVPRKANLFTWVKPPRPVPPERVWEIPGRIGPDGGEIEPLDEAAVRRAARELVAEGVRAVAVVLLHGYANPAHERRVAELVREVLPEAAVSASYEVMPVMREYERSVTTLLNAAVMPAVSTYVERLEARAAAQGIRAPLLLMKSDGGVAGTVTVRRRPVETALSGPAAGLVGAGLVGTAAGFPDLITIDIGGTSADVSLIRNGEPDLTTSGRIGDWRVIVPMVDITTIGAGGGSIARVTEGGGLAVGPESAGAVPGPACYGKGGREPTVTDAHAVLGHLPDALLDGAFALDLEAARAAIGRAIAGPLGLDAAAAARGILDVANNNMLGAIRLVSVERGHDPRDFALMPFGGAGPLHGGELARLIGCRRVVVPPAPGVLSATGLLASSLRAEFSRSCLQRGGRYDMGQVAEIFARLDREAAVWLDGEDVPSGARHLTRQASLRYEDQGSELTVPWQGGADAMGLAATLAAFHRAHEWLYGFRLDGTAIEIVTLRADAVGRLPSFALRELPPMGRSASAVVGSQVIQFLDGPRDAAIHDRRLLGAGAEVRGPAVVTQMDATTVILPGQRAVTHPLGALIVEEA